MDELLYLFPLAKPVRKAIAERLGLEKPPTYARVATVAPLSNYGLAGVDGTILHVNDAGLVYGAPNAATPRVFVPWSNIAYLGDGDALATAQKEKEEGKFSF